MEENKIYPQQPEGQDISPAQDPVPGDIVQDVQFGVPTGSEETNVSQTDDGTSAVWQQDGLSQSDGRSGQNPDPQSSDYQNNPYQSGGYPAYQNNDYQNNGYQDNGYQNSNYQSSGYQDNSYQGGNYQNNGYQNSSYQGGYQNGTYTGNAYQSYGTNYQQYNTAASYPNGQMELEEPVKISEWVLAMVLMMIPCVNIIMMFVWAFSSTEKKSKSNFFKAYLIFFGISMGVMLLVWLAVVIFALMI